MKIDSKYKELKEVVVDASVSFWNNEDSTKVYLEWYNAVWELTSFMKTDEFIALAELKASL